MHLVGTCMYRYGNGQISLSDFRQITMKKTCGRQAECDTCTAASLFNYVDNAERWEAITLFSPTVPIPFVPR